MRAFHAGDPVLYVPLEARGDVSHARCEVGVVNSVSTDGHYVYVRFGESIPQACQPEQLVLRCWYCEEPVLPGERLSPAKVNGCDVHYECGLRPVIGSVAHIEKRCLCYVPGSSDHDDPTLTRREAARRAVAAYQSREYARARGRVEMLARGNADDVPTTDQD